MKTLQILAISSLLLGLSQAANADHHEMNHDHAGKHAHGWQDADTNKDGKLDDAERKAMQAKCDHHAK